MPSTPSPTNADRMRWLIEHGEFDLPNGRRPRCHHNEHSYVSMYGRLRWDAPAQTITTGYGSMGQGRYVHPGKARTLTPHEAARLQTIPDFFDLGASNKRSTWAHVVGNAVPPLLGVHLGIPLLDSLTTRKSPTQRQIAGARPTADDGTGKARAPAASSELIRQRMKTTKRRDTAPELQLRSELDRRGLSYLVDHAVDIGRRRKADVVFLDSRVAVYVNGCYWHSCSDHGTTPKANTSWWSAKFEATRLRDAETDARLTEAGWVVLRFWEHDDLVAAASEVEAAVERWAQQNGNGTQTQGVPAASR